MSPVEALNAARAAGVRIAVDGEDLVLRASGPPPATLLQTLSLHKGDIISLLRSGADPQTNDDSSWAELKAGGLNRLFRDQGKTGEPGRITAATVRHGQPLISE